MLSCLLKLASCASALASSSPLRSCVRPLLALLVTATTILMPAPDGASEASAQRLRHPKRDLQNPRNPYVTVTPFLGVNGCDAVSPACPQDDSAGDLTLHMGMGMRFKYLSTGLRVGLHAYETRAGDPLESVEGWFGYIMGDVKLHPVFRRTRWDPYGVIGLGYMFATRSAESDALEDVVSNRAIGGEAAMFGGGVDYFVARAVAVGAVYETFVMPNKGALGDHAWFWTGRVNLTFYLTGASGRPWPRTRRPRRPRRPRAPRPKRAR